MIELHEVGLVEGYRLMLPKSHGYRSLMQFSGSGARRNWKLPNA